ncbi:MAG: GDYXXLXY domain-containing protein [Coleofasciculus sp. S288]|nr:GDYXXLXY domain-containing protein [Coleofasciculus sp. S288]
MTFNANSPNPISFWRLWIPLVFQTVLILAVPAQAVYTYLTGKTVILQTVPIDPYELLRGYSQTLRYDISTQESLRELPGWEELPKQQQQNGNKLSLLKPGTLFHVILEAPIPTDSTGLPQAWKPVAVSIERPSNLPVNQVALKGLVQAGFIEYGLETYYIPEDQREEINADLRAAARANSNQLQQNPVQSNSNRPPQKPPVVMEIKVNERGDAVPISLWARIGRDSNQRIRNYRF